MHLKMGREKCGALKQFVTKNGFVKKNREQWLKAIFKETRTKLQERGESREFYFKQKNNKLNEQ